MVQRLLIVIIIVSVTAGCAAFRVPPDTVQSGIPSFSRVDEGYFRGGQPTETGLRRVRDMGAKTVINLRHHSAATERDRRLAESLGMRWVNIPLWYWKRPTDAQIRQFLEIVQDPRQRPVFVHCRQGWNRSGVMTALYRMARYDWSPGQAYAEGKQNGMVAWNPFTRHLLFEHFPRRILRSDSTASVFAGGPPPR